MGGYIGARAGTISATVANVPTVNAQDITATDTTPEVTIVNSTHEDSDGGREGKVIFKGQQSGGEESTLAEIEANHHGSSDDEKANLIFRTNDGNDGASPSEAMRINPLGNVGIGTASVDVSTQAGGSGYKALQIESDEGGQLNFDHNDAGTGSTLGQINFQRAGEVVAEIEGVTDGATDNGRLGFRTQPDGGALTERMRIDSAGRLLIGTTTEGAANEAEDLTISSTGAVGMTIRSTDSGSSRIYFSDGTSGTPEYAGYQIYNHSDNAMIFGTNAVERMRIKSDGLLRIGNANTQAITYTGANALMIDVGTVFGNHGIDIAQGAYTGAYNVLYFRNGNGECGYIQTSGSGTTYSTGSDYRLKENVTSISNGITRLKQLKPSRFNFIADADKTLDGFLAHEAQAVVPEAVTGTKDAVQVWKEHEKDKLPDGVSVGDNKLDDDGNTIPEIQGIDQSKIVPLLTAALQEAIAKIETLETKVAALEAE